MRARIRASSRTPCAHCAYDPGEWAKICFRPSPSPASDAVPSSKNDPGSGGWSHACDLLSVLVHRIGT